MAQAQSPLVGPIPRQEHAMERTRTRAGFTLVELMVVVVILGIIGTITFAYFMDRPITTKWEVARQEMTEISKALDMYRLDHGEYPEKLSDLTNINMSKARNPFTGRDYEYERGADGQTYTLKFLGKDDVEGDAPIPDQDVILTERG